MRLIQLYNSENGSDIGLYQTEIEGDLTELFDQAIDKAILMSDCNDDEIRVDDYLEELGIERVFIDDEVGTARL